MEKCFNYLSEETNCKSNSGDVYVAYCCMKYDYFLNLIRNILTEPDDKLIAF